MNKTDKDMEKLAADNFNRINELGLEHATVPEFIELKTKKNKDKVLILFEDQKITYNEFDERSNRVANGLSQLGTKKGDRVAIMLPNCPEYLYSIAGMGKIGGVIVPINVSLKGDGLTYILNHSDAGTMIISHEYLDKYRFIQSELKRLRKLVVDTAGAPRDIKIPSNSILFEHLLKGSPEKPEVDISPADTLSTMYTSGTTGPPKGVNQAQFGVVMGFGVAANMDYTPEDVLYTCLPFFHGNATFLSFLPAMAADATLAVSRRFSASRFWDEIRKHNATEFNALGAMIPILMKQPEKPDDRDNPVKLVFSAACPADIWEAFEKRFDVEIVEGYGAVEGCFVINRPLKTGWKRRVGSFGKAITYMNEVKVVDENDNDCPPNVIGELISKPTYTTGGKVVEYYKMPDESKEKSRGGWLRTGDLSYCDEDGYFFFVGRKKDYIRRRGENISPWEIETVLAKHPAILEAAAIGVKSELGEDEVKACVALKPGMTLKPEELLSFCEDRMAYFMVPRYVEFMEQLPKTPTHRVIKPELQKAGITTNTWDREKAGYKLKKR